MPNLDRTPPNQSIPATQDTVTPTKVTEAGRIKRKNLTVLDCESSRKKMLTKSEMETMLTNVRTGLNSDWDKKLKPFFEKVDTIAVKVDTFERQLDRIVRKKNWVSVWCCGRRRREEGKKAFGKSLR